MKEKIKAGIMDAPKIRRVLNRMATEILERNRNLKNLVIIGIRTRGVFLARRIAKLVQAMEGVEIPVGIITAAVGGPFFLYLLRRRKGA